MVIGLDDNSTARLGQIYVYVEKQATGNEIEKAGLHGGLLYGIRVANKVSFPREGHETWITEGARFVPNACRGERRGVWGRAAPSNWFVSS